MMTGAAFDFIAAFGRVVGSAISSETKAILTKVTGIGPLDPDVEDGTQGELADDAETFGALGVVSRPLPPSKIGNRDVHAEVLCMRTSDGLVPISWRDLRLDKAFPAGQKEGSTALVGYGGGFFTLDLTAAASGSQKASIGVAYIPYQFDGNGVAQKAHSIILDPTAGNECINLVHGDGHAILMLPNGVTRIQSPNGQSFLQIDNSGITLQTPQIVLNGGAVVVGNPIGPIVPLAPGPASPPCPRLFLNPAS